MFELAIIYFTGSDIQFGASMRTIHIFDTLMLIFDESNLLKTDFSPVDFGTIFDIENLSCVQIDLARGFDMMLTGIIFPCQFIRRRYNSGQTVGKIIVFLYD